MTRTGSCTTGEAAERQGRWWICVEPIQAYRDGAKFRFEGESFAKATDEARESKGNVSQSELPF